MATKSFSLFGVLGLYTETPLHCGAESTAGYVDLPIQRERHSRYPVIPGSTLKGVLRDELKGAAGIEVDKVFGSADAQSPGSVSFGDGVLAAFPVRSSRAPFHWVTCPYALERVLRLLGDARRVPSPPEGQAWGRCAGRVLLEELLVEVQEKPELFGPAPQNGSAAVAARLLSLLPETGFGYLRQLLPERLLILTDQDFQELVETATEVVTRIKLNALGTTKNLTDEEAAAAGITDPYDKQGNMFVEELVPPETLFAAPLRAVEPPPALTRALAATAVLRVGGDETIGRGVTHLTLVPKEG